MGFTTINSTGTDTASARRDDRLNAGAGAAPAVILENHPTQSATTIDGWRSALFGIPFLAAGVAINLAAMGIFPARKHAPDWIIEVLGSLFFFGGVFFLVHGVCGVARKAQYLRDAEQAAGQPWRYDYHWRQDGVAFSAFHTMLGRLAGALVWTAFLTPFFWIGFHVREAWMFLIFSSIFGLIGMVFWYRWAQMLGELLRYGNSFLSYDSFPYFLGGTLRGRLRAPLHVEELDGLTLTLRCVREQYVTSGSGRNRASRVVCYELYKDSVTLTREGLTGLAGGDIPVEFRLPAEQLGTSLGTSLGTPLGTSLAATPPVYWEIEARGQSRTVNYEAYFLVPVYRAC